MAQTPAIFKDADLELGRQLIADNNCNACHAKKFGGDGSAIYRPQGRLTNAGLLRGMVEQCNTTLNLSLFPEEVSNCGRFESKPLPSQRLGANGVGEQLD